MRDPPRLRPIDAGPTGRAVRGLFHAALLAYLVLAPTVYGHLHRFGNVGLLGTVGQLLGLWVIASLAGDPPRYVRSGANVCIWLLFVLLLVHVVPLPRGGAVGKGPEALVGDLKRLVLDYGLLGGPATKAGSAGRYSLLPGAAVGVLVLVVSAAGLFWLTASSLTGRSMARTRTPRCEAALAPARGTVLRATWAVVFGLALVAVWSLGGGLAGGAAGDGGATGRFLVPVLGGDSLVPAFLAGVSLACVLVVRPLDRLPPRGRRPGTGLAWVFRPGPVWAAIAMGLGGLLGVALGASHAPPGLRYGALALAAGVPLGAYVVGSKRPGHGRRLLAAGGIAAGLAAACALGGALSGPGGEARHPPVDPLLTPGGARTWLGYGAGALSPGQTFGWPGTGPPARRDADTSGYALLAAETGLVGLALTAGLAALMAASFVRAMVRGRSPWTRLAPAAGLGALAANAVTFAFDASAVLAPNLLALAAVLGVVTAWDLHGALRRGEGDRRLGRAHWPFVAGAVGIAGALGLAETTMLPPTGGIRLGDKAMHFGTFAAICLLLCYALGPRPTSRWLRTRIALAFLAATALGAAIELGQLLLTSERAFEWLDMGANALGAALVGLFWWVLRRGQAEPQKRH